MQPKFKSKTEEMSSNATEQLSLSFLLDQNVSVDSINLPASIANSTAAKELESELKRQGTYRDILLAGNTSKLDTSTTSYKKMNSSIITGRHSIETSKPKPRVPIMSTPVTVKKKPMNEAK